MIDITIPAQISAEEPKQVQQTQQSFEEMVALMKAKLATLESRTTHMHEHQVKAAPQFSLRKYMANA